MSQILESFWKNRHNLVIEKNPESLALFKNKEAVSNAEKLNSLYWNIQIIYARILQEKFPEEYESLEKNFRERNKLKNIYQGTKNLKEAPF